MKPPIFCFLPRSVSSGRENCCVKICTVKSRKVTLFCFQYKKNQLASEENLHSKMVFIVEFDAAQVFVCVYLVYVQSWCVDARVWMQAMCHGTCGMVRGHPQVLVPASHLLPGTFPHQHPRSPRSPEITGPCFHP